MAKYKVRLVDLTTGEVRDIEMEAASEEAAVGMFDASKVKAIIMASTPPPPPPPKPELTKTPLILFGREMPDWVIGPDGGKQATKSITSIFAVLALCAVGLLAIGFIGSQTQRNGGNPDQAIGVLMAFGGSGLFSFLVIYYLAKIANKK